jgi:RNA recognition motif-containing protein
MMEEVSSDSESGDGILHGTQVTKLLRLNKEEDDVGENGSQSKSEICTDLLILGLPYKLEENELKEYFEKFGTVQLAEVDFFECFE